MGEGGAVFLGIIIAFEGVYVRSLPSLCMLISLCGGLGKG